MLLSSFSVKFDSFDEGDEEYQDSVFDRSTGVWKRATDDDDDARGPTSVSCKLCYTLYCTHKQAVAPKQT